MTTNPYIQAPRAFFSCFPAKVIVDILQEKTFGTKVVKAHFGYFQSKQNRSFCSLSAFSMYEAAFFSSWHHILRKNMLIIIPEHEVYPRCLEFSSFLTKNSVDIWICKMDLTYNRDIFFPETWPHDEGNGVQHVWKVVNKVKLCVKKCNR